MAASHMSQGRGACTAFRPPPGLAKNNHMDLAPPPGLEHPIAATCPRNCTRPVLASTPANEWSLERTLEELSISTAMNLRASLKALQYPSKPPGIFEQPPPQARHQKLSDTISSASTAASELGEDNDSIPEMSTGSICPTETLRPMEETHKEFLRELQIQPMDKACARPLKVLWPVDSKKLHARDKQVVSPSFEVFPGCFFKLMLKPKAMGDKKYQEGFRKARGRGSVELKCVDESSLAPTLRFWISVGDGSLRGPVTHNFSESTVSGLTTREDIFDFSSAVDDKSSTFLVTLQAFPMDTSVPGQ